MQPCRSSTVRIASCQRAITRRRDSGSSRSPSGVDSIRSQKRTVTTFRTARGGACSRTRGAAQPEQNWASSAFCRPQWLQTATNPSLGRLTTEAQRGLEGVHAAGLLSMPFKVPQERRHVLLGHAREELPLLALSRA